MSLAILLYSLADQKLHDPEGETHLRECFAQINVYLQLYELPLHVEPETVGPQPQCARCDMRYGTFVKLGELWVEQRARNDKKRNAFQHKNSSHLANHSDSSGFYVPVDFERPFRQDVDDPPLPGGSVGSSQRLLAELTELAPYLGVDANHPQAIKPRSELHEGWQTLFTAAQISVQHGTAIQLA